MSRDENPPYPGLDPVLESSPPVESAPAAVTRINPYAPTIEAAASGVVRSEVDVEPIDSPTTLGRTAVRWGLVCGISAVPSFVYGIALTEGQIAGMLLGILIFATGYTIVDYQTASRPFRRKKTIRRTLKITYGTRIAISLLFPVGLYLDLMCGIVSIGLVNSVVDGQVDAGGNSMTFGVSLLTTLVQGCVLNVVLGVYGLLIHAIQVVVIAVRA